MAKLYLGTNLVKPTLYKDVKNNQDKTITENGTYTADSGYTGLGEVTVAVPNQTESITVTENGTYNAPTGKLGYNQVTVAVPKVFIFEDKTVTDNGTYTASQGHDGFHSFTADVAQTNLVKCGCTIDTFIGNTVGGVLQAPSAENLIFTGVRDLGDSVFYYKFYNNTNIRTVSFPDLEQVSGNQGMYDAFKSCTSLTSADLSSLTEVSGSSGMYETFRDCSNLTSLDLSGLTTISGNNGLYWTCVNCRSLTSVDLSNLTTISSSNGMYATFAGSCTSLTSVDLSNLTTISGNSGMYYAFEGCISLASVDLSSLTTISGSEGMSHTFRGCTNLTSVDLSNLVNISGSQCMYRAFYNCTSLRTLSFPSLTSTSFGSYTNQFNDMLQGCSNVTVHFPAILQSVLGSWSDVTNGFSGTNTTVLFDLNGATINFNVTSAGTPTYYIAGYIQQTPSIIISLDDIYYLIESTEGVYRRQLTNLQENETRNITVDLTNTSFNALTLATDQSDCTVKFTLDGYELQPTTVNGSNYILNLNSTDNASISYEIKKKGYKKVIGTISYTGSNVTENITMEVATTEVEIDLQPTGVTYGWQVATVTNPTAYSMYESTNTGQHSTQSVMKVTISGYNTFTCYINNYAESGCDYTMASTIDASSYPTTNGQATVYACNPSKQYTPEIFNTTNWTTVTYNNLGGEEHFFYIVYRKDGSVNTYNDRGYFIIDEDQSE